ncbi:MAG: hypothetical protein QME51_02485, partial [Planctomycetota bacterium]|nr:hypothetical protein [Planctomycetota bacterium]
SSVASACTDGALPPKASLPPFGARFARRGDVLRGGAPECVANTCISFIKDGDSSEFVIALASIFSKYYRELAMLKLNNFFCSYIPSFKPISGYPVDSKKAIRRKIVPLLNQLKLDRDNFIRKR